jgi:glutamate/tyrosine decarboxylase-like PLP-dependent enzyme
MNQPLAASQADALLTALCDHHTDNISTEPHYLALLREAESYSRHDKAAHMTPDLAPYSLLGMQLAVLHQGNLLSAELYPRLKQAESDTLNWFKTCFDLPHAHFSHGGSDNNLQALWQARDHSSNGRKIVYASEARHYSIDKACRILGLDLVLIRCDGDDRIDITALETACRKRAPLAIIMTAGTSAAGAVDPIQPASDIVSKYQSWLHVDAAWGGALLMLPEHRDSLMRLTQLDSVGFDPHKSLFQPRPCSVYLSRHAPRHSLQTDYLNNTPSDRVTGSYGAEMFLPLWLNLKILGEEWFYQQTRARLEQAQLFSELLRKRNIKTWNGGSGIICFEAEGEAFDTLVASGFLSKAKMNQKTVYRAVFAGIRTQAEALFRVLPLSP